MVNYQYTYLIGNLVLLIPWLILFFYRKDTRKEMIYASVFFGIIGLIVEAVYGTDWWHPKTITNTLPGPESFLFGFLVGGISAIIYCIIFNKKVQIKKVSEKKENKRNLHFSIFLFLGLIVFLIGTYLIKLNTFYASIPAFLIPLLIIWTKRKDLILNSILSGFLLLIISFFAYIIPELITPGWIASSWYLENLSGILIFKIPIEDLIWFFLAGLAIGPLYEYWQEGKLINKK